MRSSCEGNVISRWGGEEFLILSTGSKDIHSRMEDLRKKVESTDFVFDGKKIDVTITIGLAEKEDTRSIDKWIQRADEKLYQGKNSGKNVVIV